MTPSRPLGSPWARCAGTACGRRCRCWGSRSGIAAVVALTALGEGARLYVVERVRRARQQPARSSCRARSRRPAPPRSAASRTTSRSRTPRAICTAAAGSAARAAWRSARRPCTTATAAATCRCSGTTADFARRAAGSRSPRGAFLPRATRTRAAARSCSAGRSQRALPRREPARSGRARRDVAVPRRRRAGAARAVPRLRPRRRRVRPGAHGDAGVQPDAPVPHPRRGARCTTRWTLAERAVSR